MVLREQSNVQVDLVMVSHLINGIVYSRLPCTQFIIKAAVMWNGFKVITQILFNFHSLSWQTPLITPKDMS